MSLSSTFKEYKFFYSLLGYKIFLILAFSFFASLIETVGLILFIPDILNIAFDNLNEASTPLKIFLSFFEIDFKSNFFELIALLIVFYILKAIFLFIAYFYIGKSRAELLAEIRLHLYRGLSQTIYADFIAQERSNIVSRLKEQSTESVSAFTSFVQVFNSFLNVIVYFIGAIFLQPALGTIGAISGLIILLIFKRLNSNLRVYSIKNVEYHANFTKHILQFVNAFKYIKSTNQEDRFEKKSENLTLLSRKIESIYAKYNAITASSKEPVAIIIFFIIFALGFMNNLAASTSLGVLMLFYKASNNVFILQGQIQNYLQFNGSLRNIIREYKKIGKIAEIKNISNQEIIFKSLIFKDVKYKYPNTAETIIFPNFEVKFPGLCVIKGPSGSGKSTLFNLLLKNLTPSGGSIFLDSKKLSEIDENFWKRSIGYVPQQQVVFDGSIAQNISMKFDNELSRKSTKKIKAAAIDAQIDDFIESLPNGYETMLGDYSFEISGGQIQRLMLARELYRSPKILILDEPTSALDKTSKLKIINVINKIKLNALVFVITHNPEDFSEQMLTIEMTISHNHKKTLN